MIVMNNEDVSIHPLFGFQSVHFFALFLTWTILKESKTKNISFLFSFLQICAGRWGTKHKLCGGNKNKIVFSFLKIGIIKYFLVPLLKCFIFLLVKQTITKDKLV